MGVSLDGLVSGLDTSSIISGLVAAAATNQNRLKAQRADVELKKDHWSTMEGHLTALKSAIEAINTASEFKSMTATSSLDSRVTPEVSGTALAGTYTVNVSQLASSQTSKSSESFADGTTAFITAGSPELTITVNGGTPEVIALTDNTLDGAIAAVNDANLGVQAYKIQQSDGTYVMMVTSEDTGEDYDFTITTNDTDGTPITFNTIATAQNTLATVNGISVSSTSNTLADVIPGVTLTVLDDSDTDEDGTSEDFQVVVGTDREKVKENIGDFVSKYNTVLSYISFEVKFNDVSEEAGPLSGDNTLRQLQRTLQDRLRATYTTNDIDTLSALGITTLKDGTLSVDDDDLADALDTKFSQVIDFFTADDGLFASITNSSDTGTLDLFLQDSDGTLATKYDALDEQIETYTESIEKEEDRLARLEETLRAKFTAMEVTLSKLKLSEAYVNNVLAKNTSKND